MATQRTISELLTLLADNASRAISEADMRDVVETLRGRYGELYITSAAATTIANTASFFPVNGTWTLGDAVDFSEATNGLLQYDGVVDTEVFVVASVSFTVAANSQVVDFRLAKNGTTIAATESSSLGLTGSLVQTVTIVGIVELSPGDEIGIETRNETSTADVTAELANMVARTMNT